jgi:hypothetical protein
MVLKGALPQSLATRPPHRFALGALQRLQLPQHADALRTKGNQ